MKKILFRAEAALIAVSVFFCSIVYRPLPVEAAAFVVTEAVKYALYALGYAAVDNLVIDPILESLGWKSTDIQVDENGNVILSEAQMNELKEAVKEATQGADGDDLYGAFLWPEEKPAYDSVNAWLLSKGKNEENGFPNFTPSPCTGGGCVWDNYPYYTINGNVKGVYYVHEALNDNVFFYDSSGSIVSFEGYRYSYLYQGGSGTWVSNGTFSNFDAASYVGPQLMVFPNLSSLQRYIEDGSPYELITPTYTGGTLTIPKDQVPDPGTEPGEDFDEDGNPTTEKGWLQRIYERLGDILDQIKMIKWISVADTIIDAFDAFGEDVVDGVANIASAAVGLLSEVFPLCIFWDIIRVVGMFDAEPLEPVFTFSFDFSALGLEEDYVFVIDLTEYDTIFAMLRFFEVLIFVGGLWKVTLNWVGKGDDV
ncbi:MAG: hypothetical protein J6K58_04810 [Lachnospiraceae bacterium]|nr:hypothetical protein [Lachnospiraceae bacterium]